MGWGGTVADADCVVFRLPRAEHAATEARLWLDLEHHVEPRLMQMVDGGWELAIARPPVWRVEYLYDLRFADGSRDRICDPTNPKRVRTAFGEHSVIEFPDYRPPAWLATAAGFGRTTRIVVRALDLRPPMPITVWSPDGCHDGARLPMLVVHDGPEFDRLASFTRFSAAMIAAGRLPAHRVALLSPGDRNRWYAAAPSYARALSRLVLPAIREAVGVDRSVALAGASLGALAALHAVCTEPSTAGALFLQSGSFFRPDLDAQERSFAGFGAVTEFVERLETAMPDATSLRIGMTCGTGEENLANNRTMARTLTRLGHDVTFTEVPDAHTYVGWRDALDPHLVDVLAATWARRH
jgi:enterochelin esterase-like enzyme